MNWHLRLGPQACAVAAALMLSLAACGAREPANPTEKIIKSRQENFKSIGGAMKTIGDESKAKTPDMAKIAAAADRILALGKEIPNWFPAGSGPESGLKTEAKAEIWTDNARFRTQHEEFVAEATNLVEAVKTGDAANVKAQFFATGVACANCHKPFRVDKKH